jgi:hypothetical protein
MMLISTFVPAADRAGFPRRRRQRIRRQLMRGFRHAVRLEDRGTECRFERTHYPRWQRRAAGTDETKLLAASRSSAGGICGARQQQLVDRRHGGKPRHAKVPGHAPERQRIEARGQNDRAAGQQRRQRRRHQSVDVKQRHHAHRHVAGPERIAPRDVGSGDGHVGVRKRDTLRPARTPAGVQHQRDILRRRLRRYRDRDERRRKGLRYELDHPGRGQTCCEDWYAIACRASSFFSAIGRQNQDAGSRILEIEAKFIFPVGGIQRRRRTGH